MTSFVSQVMQPGGGIMLLPFVRLVIGLLLTLTLVGFFVGVARIHMAVLSVLSGGLLISLSFFESEYKKAQSRIHRGQKSQATTTTAATGSNSGKAAKTD